MRYTILLLTLLVGTGCDTGSRSSVPGDAAVESESADGSFAPMDLSIVGNDNVDAAQVPCQKMDIVFVIDNSDSMVEEQENLIDNLPGFIDVLETFQTKAGDLLDYRVAVTTTGRDVNYTAQLPFGSIPIFDRGDDGEFLKINKCGMTRHWLERGDPDLTASFECLADVGLGGPLLEMPLYVVQLAFTARITDGKNAGFLRPDALLAIVILTDEDDCSREDNNFTVADSTSDTETVCGTQGLPWQPPSKYVDFLDDLVGGHGRWAVAVVAGAGPGSCTSSFGDAMEAKRLKQFAAGAGTTGVVSSICSGDLTTALNDALATFTSACDQLPPIM